MPLSRRSRASRFLANLDRRVLPPIARAFARASQGGRRGRVLVAVGVAASFLAASIAVYAANRPSAATPVPGPIVTIGVKAGDSIPDYIKRRKAALNDIVTGSKNQMFALVAFKSYVTPNGLLAIVQGVTVVNALVHVPPTVIAAFHGDPSQPTHSILVKAYRLPEDVTNAMMAEASNKLQNVKDYHSLETLAPSLPTSAAEKAKAQEMYRRAERMAKAEYYAYRSLCACVYAVVVYATPAALHALAARWNVRVVDPQPTLRSADRAVFLPPLPEQTKIAKPPSGAPDAFP
jgi:hypothetical protein